MNSKTEKNGNPLRALSTRLPRNCQFPYIFVIFRWNTRWNSVYFSVLDCLFFAKKWVLTCFQSKFYKRNVFGQKFWPSQKIIIFGGATWNGRPFLMEQSIPNHCRILLSRHEIDSSWTNKAIYTVRRAILIDLNIDLMDVFSSFSSDEQNGQKNHVFGIFWAISARLLFRVRLNLCVWALVMHIASLGHSSIHAIQR